MTDSISKFFITQNRSPLSTKLQNTCSLGFLLISGVWLIVIKCYFRVSRSMLSIWFFGPKKPAYLTDLYSAASSSLIRVLYQSVLHSISVLFVDRSFETRWACSIALRFSDGHFLSLHRTSYVFPCVSFWLSTLLPQWQFPVHFASVFQLKVYRCMLVAFWDKIVIRKG